MEIVLQNTLALNGVAEMHTWHLHGHSFWVVGSGVGIFDRIPTLIPTTLSILFVEILRLCFPMDGLRSG